MNETGERKEKGVILTRGRMSGWWWGRSDCVV